MRIHQSMQSFCMLFHVAQFTEMREIHHSRREGHQQIDRPVHGLGIELNGCCGWKSKLTAVSIEFPVRKAKGVAGKDSVAATIDDTDVMSRVPRRIQAEEFSRTQANNGFVRCLYNPARLDREYLAVQAANFRRPIDGGCPGYQFARISHMPRAPRVDDEACIRKRAHKRAGPSCMIQMNMGEDDVLDAVFSQAHRFQGRQHLRQRIVCSRINDCDAALFDNKVDRRMQVPDIAGINGTDTMSVVKNL